MFQDNVEQRLQVRACLGGKSGTTGRRLGIHNWEIRLLLAGTQLDEQVERLVEDPGRLGILAVDLIDHHNGLVPHLERLLEHEARLRHGAFGGIDQQQHAVHHVHDAFHLAAKVGVAGRIDDVDLNRLAGLGIVQGNGRVFGENRDAPLAFEVVRIHHPLFHVLVVAESMGLAQQAVHQGGLAVVHMGDDGNISEIGSFN